MAAITEYDLATLRLRSGDGRRLSLEVDPGPLDGSGGDYDLGARPVPLSLEVSRTTTGYALHLSAECDVVGDCARCLTEAAVPVAIDAREIEDLGSDDEELTSPYVDAETLDLRGWLHDTIVLGIPAQFVCRPDCKGLCDVCGVTLNDADPQAHKHGGGGDPRFAKLRELLE